MTRPWEQLAPGTSGQQRWLHHCTYDAAGTRIMSRALIEDFNGCWACASKPPDFDIDQQLTLALARDEEVTHGTRTTA